MADYNETDHRPRTAQDLDKILDAAVDIRNALTKLEGIRAVLTVNREPSKHPLFADQIDQMREAYRPANELLLGEVTELLGAVATGSSAQVHERVLHLMQLQEIEESFPGQQR